MVIVKEFKCIIRKLLTIDIKPYEINVMFDVYTQSRGPSIPFRMYTTMLV